MLCAGSSSIVAANPDLALQIDEELRKQLPNDTTHNNRMSIVLKRVQTVIDQIDIIRRYLNF